MSFSLPSNDYCAAEAIHDVVQAEGDFNNYAVRFETGYGLNDYLSSLLKKEQNPKTGYLTFQTLQSYKFFGAQATVAAVLPPTDHKHHIDAAIQANRVLYGSMWHPDFTCQLKATNFDELYSKPKRSLLSFVGFKTNTQDIAPYPLTEEQRYYLNRDFAASLTALVCKTYQIYKDPKEAYAGADRVIGLYKNLKTLG